jgi:hypothetical protein
MLSDKTVPRLSIDPFSDGFLAEPYAHHALLRDAGPVFSAGMLRYLRCCPARSFTPYAESVHVCLAGRTAPTGYPDKLKADQALNQRSQIAQTMGRKIGPRNRH